MEVFETDGCLFDSLPCRIILSCTRCRTGSKPRRERKAQTKVASGSPLMTMNTTVMTRAVARKSNHHLVQSIDPRNLRTLRASVARQCLPEPKSTNALGLRLRNRLKRSPSSPRSPLKASEGLAQDQGGCSRHFCVSVLLSLFAFALFGNFYVTVDSLSHLTE